MPLKTGGPDVGDRLAELTVQTAQGEPLQFGEIDARAIILIMFRGNW